MKKFEYPYNTPEGCKISYTPENNEFILKAKEYARNYSLDKVMPTGAAIVKNGVVIGLGSNGSDYHEKNGCERKRLGIPTGEGYELCEGCNPINHAEPKAIKNAKEQGNDPTGCDLYLWGHYWCCEDCWNAMLGSGIKNVFLMDNSFILFDREEDGNIVGKQFS